MMFTRENVYAMVAGFGVRVKDEREQDRNHLVEVDFEVPLTYDLADEIQPAMARDLFLDTGGEWKPKPEITRAMFALMPTAQVMTIRSHPDLDADVRIGGVTLRRIEAQKAEAGTWALKFKATWTLGDPKEATVMIQRLKSGVYMTLVEQQPALPMDGPAEVVEGQVVSTDGQGTVTDIAKARGRKKKKPRNEYPDIPVTQCPGCKMEIPNKPVCPLCGADVPQERPALPPAADDVAGPEDDSQDGPDGPTAAPGSDTVQ